MPFQTHKTFLLNLIELLNEVIIFVFFAYKKVFSTTVVTWTNNVLTTFLGLERGRKLSDFIKNILICVPKMNEGLTGLERHEGD